jgi:DNA-binding PadR family transcriptional regulator
MQKRRQKPASEREVMDALPVRPSALAVMAALADGALPGFAILERANEGLARPVLGPGTLYRLLRDMRQEQLIVRVDAPDDDASDERRQYHELTRFGSAVLRAEAARLQHALGAAGLLRPAR